MLDASVGDAFAAIGKLVTPGSAAPGVEEVEPWRLYFAAMLAPASPHARSGILERLSAGRRIHDAVRHLERFERESASALDAVGPVGRSAVYRALRRFSVEALLVAVATHRSPRVRERVAMFLSDLRGVKTSLTGSDLVALGVPEGPRVGKILAELLDARLDGKVSSEEGERGLAERLSQELDAGHKSC